MERTRRATKENNLWGNPCDFTDSSSNQSTKVFRAIDATQLAKQARSTLSAAEEFKDVFARKLHSYNSFDELLPTWDMQPWLRKFPWVSKLVFPETKTRVEQIIPKSHLDEVVSNIDKVLPSMNKALKMVMAGLNGINNGGLNMNFNAEKEFHPHFNLTMGRVRQVLCMLNEIMTARHLEILPLYDSETPNVENGDRLGNIFLIYRDTLLYLDYLAQVMDAWASQA